MPRDTRRTCTALPRVRPHVRRQRSRRRERRVAHVALVRPLPRVRPHVPRQRSRLRERRVAHVALVRPLSRMHAHVHHQLAAVRTRRAAHFALVRPRPAAAAAAAAPRSRGRVGHRAHPVALSRHVTRARHVAVVVLTVAGEGAEILERGRVVRGLLWNLLWVFSQTR